MRPIKCLIFVLIISFFSNNLKAQSGTGKNEENNSAPSIKKLSVTEAQTDFDTLRKALEEAHGGLYRFSTKSDWERRFEVYRKKLNQPVSQPEFIAFLSEMLAETRDGHLRLEYDEATAAAIGKARLFPFRVFIEESRLMVMFNETLNDSTIRP